MPSLRTRAEPVVTTWYQDREGREPKPPECVPSALTWPRCRERADGEHSCRGSVGLQRDCAQNQKSLQALPHKQPWPVSGPPKR